MPNYAFLTIKDGTSSMPQELYSNILYYLDKPDLHSFCLTSKSCAFIARKTLFSNEDSHSRSEFNRILSCGNHSHSFSPPTLKVLQNCGHSIFVSGKNITHDLRLNLIEAMLHAGPDCERQVLADDRYEQYLNFWMQYYYYQPKINNIIIHAPVFHHAKAKEYLPVKGWEVLQNTQDEHSRISACKTLTNCAHLIDKYLAGNIFKLLQSKKCDTVGYSEYNANFILLQSIVDKIDFIDKISFVDICFKDYEKTSNDGGFTDLKNSLAMLTANDYNSHSDIIDAIVTKIINLNTPTEKKLGLLVILKNCLSPKQIDNIYPLLKDFLLSKIGIYGKLTPTNTYDGLQLFFAIANNINENKIISLIPYFISYCDEKESNGITFANNIEPQLAHLIIENIYQNLENNKSPTVKLVQACFYKLDIIIIIGWSSLLIQQRNLNILESHGYMFSELIKNKIKLLDLTQLVAIFYQANQSYHTEDTKHLLNTAIIDQVLLLQPDAFADLAINYLYICNYLTDNSTVDWIYHLFNCRKQIKEINTSKLCKLFDTITNYELEYIKYNCQSIDDIDYFDNNPRASAILKIAKILSQHEIYQDKIYDFISALITHKNEFICIAGTKFADNKYIHCRDDYVDKITSFYKKSEDICCKILAIESIFTNFKNKDIIAPVKIIEWTDSILKSDSIECKSVALISCGEAIMKMSHDNSCVYAECILKHILVAANLSNLELQVLCESIPQLVKYYSNAQLQQIFDIYLAANGFECIAALLKISEFTIDNNRYNLAVEKMCTLYQQEIGVYTDKTTKDCNFNKADDREPENLADLQYQFVSTASVISFKNLKENIKEQLFSTTNSVINSCCTNKIRVIYGIRFIPDDFIIATLNYALAIISTIDNKKTSQVEKILRVIFTNDRITDTIHKPENICIKLGTVIKKLLDLKFTNDNNDLCSAIYLTTRFRSNIRSIPAKNVLTDILLDIYSKHNISSLKAQYNYCLTNHKEKGTTLNHISFEINIGYLCYSIALSRNKYLLDLDDKYNLCTNMISVAFERINDKQLEKIHVNEILQLITALSTSQAFDLFDIIIKTFKFVNNTKCSEEVKKDKQELAAKLISHISRKIPISPKTGPNYTNFIAKFKSIYKCNQDNYPLFRAFVADNWCLHNTAAMLSADNMILFRFPRDKVATDKITECTEKLSSVRVTN